MFLKSLIARNPRFLEAVVSLHQSGEIPANSYAIDLDTLAANTRRLSAAAKAKGLTVYAMTKQLGRAPGALDAITEGGADGYVAVDMDCARPISANGHRIGHLGHLVQVPKHEAGDAARMRPEYWTVFSLNKAKEAAEAAREAGIEQKILIRVFGEGDEFYTGHEGGVALADLPRAIDFVESSDGASFAGLTTFPALLFDSESNWARITSNMRTVAKAAQVAASLLPDLDLQINAPGTTSTAVLDILAEAGANQVEPGHGLTGTTPLHALNDLPELPAVLYLSEVAHIHLGTPLCFGGGLYIDPVFGEYQAAALVAHDPSDLGLPPVPADIPSPAAIDYYTRLHPPQGRVLEEGASVLFGFRIQAFVTRARIVGISGIQSGSLSVEGCWNSFGQPMPQVSP